MNEICCDTSCYLRLECKKFLRALDVNAGRLRRYTIIKCNNQKLFEK